MNEIEKLLFEKFQVRRRLVEIRDSSFILSLRTNERLSKFISTTENNLSKQEKWIELYKIREINMQEFYFIFESDKNIPYGLIRIYNIDEHSFEIGSWIFTVNSPEGLSILADLSVRDFAFENFNFDFCRFEVRKMNNAVAAYHKRFMPEKIGEDELSFSFQLSRNKYYIFRNKLLNFYSHGNK